MSDSVWPQRQQPTRLPRPWDSPGKNIGVGCHFLLQCVKVKSEREVAQALLGHIICKYLLTFHRLCFLFVYGFLCSEKAYKFKSHLFIFAFLSFSLEDWPNKTLVRFTLKTIFCIFSSRSFMMSCFIFKTFSHFQLIFVYGVREYSNFIDIRVPYFMSIFRNLYWMNEWQNW